MGSLPVSRVSSLLIGLVAVAGCMPVWVEGPKLPDSRVIEIVTTSLFGHGEPLSTQNPETINEVLSSDALNQSGWERNEGRTLIPLYRIEMRADSGLVYVYYLGANSYPPRFPCYSLCSGWWFGASTSDGAFDPTRFKRLADMLFISFPRSLQLPGYL